MLMRNKYLAAVVAASMGLAAAGAVQGQGREPPPDEPDPTRDQIVELVTAAMPPVIGGNNQQLVQNLMGAQLAQTPLVKGFNYEQARAAVFGPRIRPPLDRDCPRTQTDAGVPSEDDCTAALGDPAGDKAYTALEFSKNMGFGNVRVLMRPDISQLPKGPDDLKPVPADMTDSKVYEMGLNYLGALGLPLDEIQVPDDPDALPVHDLQIGFDPSTQRAPVTIQKVVYLQRGLKLPTPLQDPAGGPEMTHVPAPGMARVAFDANGQVVGAMIRGWQDLARNPAVNPELAKTHNQLVDEIVQDLLRNGGGPIGTVKILIGLMTDFQGTQGMLLPAVQVFVAPVADPQPGQEDDVQTTQTTGAYVREYLLVDIEEAEAQDR
jgi:hypothetical protein